MKVLFSVMTLTSLFLFACNSNKQQSISKLNSGKIYYSKNKYDSTIICLTEAIKLDSSNSEAFFYLGKTNYMIHNYNDAMRYLKLAEKYEYNSDSIQYLKLELLFAMEEYDNYIEYCNKIISKNTSDYKMYFNKATALFNKACKEQASARQIELAKESLKSVNVSLKLNTHNYETFVLRGAIRYLLEDYKGAIDDLDITIKKEKKDSNVISQAYRYKSHSMIKLNQINTAEYLLDTAIVFNKMKPRYYLERGDIRVLLKKNKLACDDYRKALELGDNDAIEKLRENCR